MTDDWVPPARSPKDVPDEHPPPTLAEFLLARLGERERVAQAATPGPWHWDISDGAFDGEVTPTGGAEWGHSGPDLVAADGDEVITSSGYDADNVIVGRADAAHIALHDPARVLAEVAAQRQIVELHTGQPEFPDTEEGRDMSVDECGQCMEDCPCTTLRLLALPHAAYPGYRQDWAP